MDANEKAIMKTLVDHLRRDLKLWRVDLKPVPGGLCWPSGGGGGSK